MSTETEPRRGPGRPPLRAEAREETREQPRLTRKHKRSEDKYAVPEHLLKPGFDYNWKVVEVGGKPVDPYELIAREENHWEPVMASGMPSE